MKLRFYRIQKEYLKYLSRFEKKVPYLKENRPFLGIVLQMQNKSYFVPLSSPKEKHHKMRELKDIVQIQKGEWGVINFNNMIPVAEGEYIEIKIQKIKDRKYRWLLQHQLQWCETHKTQIQQTAKEIYQKRQYSFGLQQRCCNFKKLEVKCIQYQNQLRDQQSYYQVS